MTSSSRAPHPTTRRAVLRGAGMLGLSAALAACGIPAGGPGATGSSSGSGSGAASSGAGSGTGSSATARSTSPSVDRSDTDKFVNWSNWPEYIDTADDNPGKHPTLDEFTAETGIAIHYTEDINDNNEWLAKIQPSLSVGRPIAADMFVVSDWMFTKLNRLGYVQDLDHDNIPNLKNALPVLQHFNVDPGRKKSVTWQSGFTGIAYNTSVTGKPIDSVDQLLTDPALKGKVTLLTEIVDTVGLVLLDMGYDSQDFTDSQFNAAIAKLQRAVDSGQIRQFTGNDYAQGLVSGDVAACMAWAGDIVQLQLDNSNLEYALPDAGFMLWSDNLVIPIGSPHKENAEKVINYYYRPDVAAKVSDWVNYISPVVGAKAVLEKDDPEVANNPLIFPADDVLARGKGFMVLTEEQENRYDAAFGRLMGT